MDDRITQDNVATNSQPTQPIQNNVQSNQTVPAQPQVTQDQDQSITQQATQAQPEVIVNPSQPSAEPQPFNAQVQPSANEQVYKEEGEKKYHKMKEILDKQPKVTIMVPLKPGENPESWEYVAINGYPIHIKKNVMVEVPQQVAQIISESYNITSVVGKEHLIDARSDRQTALK